MFMIINVSELLSYTMRLLEVPSLSLFCKSPFCFEESFESCTDESDESDEQK